MKLLILVLLHLFLITHLQFKFTNLYFSLISPQFMILYHFFNKIVTNDVVFQEIIPIKIMINKIEFSYLSNTCYLPMQMHIILQNRLDACITKQSY